MKDWWQNLSLREKQTVAFGTLLVMIFIVYELMFASLAGSVDHLRAQILKNKTLLSWMRESDARIQQLEKNQKPIESKDAGSLLSVVQDDIKNNPISKSMTQLQQSDNDAVELRFQQVSFDDMMQWLIAICREQDLTISQMTITPESSAGVVDAVLKLQTAG